MFRVSSVDREPAFTIPIEMAEASLRPALPPFGSRLTLHAKADKHYTVFVSGPSTVTVLMIFPWVRDSLGGRVWCGSSPVGTQENSPGREPGELRWMWTKSPGGAAETLAGSKSVCRPFVAQPDGRHQFQGLTPRACLACKRAAKWLPSLIRRG